MKPTKKKPAKRAVVRGSIEHKLMQLHNRIDEMYRNGGPGVDGDDTRTDKSWVWMLIEDLQNKKFTKLCKEDFDKCNGLWKQYETR